MFFKVDIINVFHAFHAKDMFDKSFSGTFISLISKKSRAIDVKDFFSY
jgi:hypothetical protein